MKTLVLTLLAALCLPLAAAAQERGPELADLLARMADGGKRRFIYDEQASSRFREEKARIIPAGAESDESFATGIEILKSANLALVSVETGAIPTWKVVWTEKARDESLRTFDSVAALPATNEYCALQVTLKFLRVRDVFSTVQTLLADPRDAVVLESAETLLMTGFSGVLRAVGKLLAGADVAPAEGVSWRITVAAVEASEGGDGACPEAFKAAGLPGATGKKTFRLIADGCVSVMTGGPAGKNSGSARVALVLGPEGAMDVLMGLNRDAAGAPMLDSVEARGKEGNVAGASLSARLALREGAWVVAGTIPTKEADRAVVVLLHAEKVK